MTSTESNAGTENGFGISEETRVRISIANAIDTTDGSFPATSSIYDSELLTTTVPNSLRTWTLIRDVLEEHTAHANRLAVTIAHLRRKMTDENLSVWLELVLKYHGIIAGPTTGGRAFKNSDSLSVIYGLRQYGREFTDEEGRKLVFATGFLDSNHLDEIIVNDYVDLDTDETYSVFGNMELVDLVVRCDWDRLRAVVDGVKAASITRIPQLMEALRDRSIALSEGAL